MFRSSAGPSPLGKHPESRLEPGVSARGRSRPDSVTPQRLSRAPVREAENQISFASGDQASEMTSNQSLESGRTGPVRSATMTSTAFPPESGGPRTQPDPPAVRLEAIRPGSKTRKALCRSGTRGAPCRSPYARPRGPRHRAPSRRRPRRSRRLSANRPTAERGRALPLAPTGGPRPEQSWTASSPERETAKRSRFGRLRGLHSGLPGRRE